MIESIFSSENKALLKGKTDIEKSIFYFQNILLNNINNLKALKQNLIQLGKTNAIENDFIRGIAWRIFLDSIFIDEKSTLKTLIEETMTYRKNIREKIDKSRIKKIVGDPLALSPNKSDTFQFPSA